MACVLSARIHRWWQGPDRQLHRRSIRALPCGKGRRGCGEIALAARDLSLPKALISTTVAEGLIIPFVLIGILLLVEDYRNLEANAENPEPSISPPTTGL